MVLLIFGNSVEIKCEFKRDTDVHLRRLVRISVVQGTLSLYIALLWSSNVAT